MTVTIESTFISLTAPGSFWIVNKIKWEKKVKAKDYDIVGISMWLIKLTLNGKNKPELGSKI
jgi:hypothetical protein